MFCINLVLFYIFGYCASQNMSNYKLLSNTPITTYCPEDLKHLYRIYEKHPDLSEISICCATRISSEFMMTEQVCIKKYNPKYITVSTFLDHSLVFMYI